MRFAAAFGTLAGVLVCWSLVGSPWRLAALWPALSLACVSCAYLRGAPGVFGKQRDGSRESHMASCSFPTFSTPQPSGTSPAGSGVSRPTTS